MKKEFAGVFAFVIAIIVAAAVIGVVAINVQRDAVEKAASPEAIVEVVPFEVLSFDESHVKYGVNYHLDLAIDGERAKTTYDETVARAHNGDINKYDFYRTFAGVKVGDTVTLRVIRADGGDYDYFLVENISAKK